MKIHPSNFSYYLKKFREKSKIILYGNKKMVDNLKNYTEIIGYELGECYYDNEMYLNILYEDIDNIFVWVVSDDNYLKLCDNLKSIGLRQHLEFGLFNKAPYGNIYERFYLDTHLGYTTSITEKYPGVVVFGNQEEAEDSIRIVTLGGSTSDSKAYLWKCWSELLHERFTKENIDKVVVYSAGVCSYTTAHELIKLQRDLIGINPHIVISFDGLNDCYTRNNSFYNGYMEYVMKQISVKGMNEELFGKVKGYTSGVVEELSPEEMWLKNTRLMNAVCNEFGIKYFSFIQPMVGVPGMKLTATVKEFNNSDFTDIIALTRSFVTAVRKKIGQYEYIYDISDILIGHEEVFIDNMHVYEDGNVIIANKIYDIIHTCYKFDGNRRGSV